MENIYSTLFSFSFFFIVAISIFSSLFSAYSNSLKLSGAIRLISTGAIGGLYLIIKAYYCAIFHFLVFGTWGAILPILEKSDRKGTLPDSRVNDETNLKKGLRSGLQSIILSTVILLYILYLPLTFVPGWSNPKNMEGGFSIITDIGESIITSFTLPCLSIILIILTITAGSLILFKRVIK